MKRKTFKTNDYINTTKTYLKQYNLLIQYLENVRESLEDIDSRLTGGEVKAVTYDKGVRGSCCDVNGIARQVFKRMDLKDERERLQADTAPIERHIKRIESSLEQLTADERGILLDYYAKKLNYAQLVEKYHYSDRWCRRILRQAERKMAIMLFGTKATEPILFLGDENPLNRGDNNKGIGSG